MITFDKLKLVISRDYIQEEDLDAYETTTNKDGEITRQTFTVNTPFSVRVEIVHTPRNKLYENPHTVSIEFTSKILVSDSHLLISRETIDKCLESIKKTAGLTFDNKALIHHAEVVLCHVTRDETESPVNTIKKALKRQLNHNKWQTRKHPSGIELITRAQSKKNRYRICIYDKYKELHKASGKPFLQLLTSADVEKYKGITRFELNLNCIYVIKKSLQIPDNKLITVLHGTDPLPDIYRTIFIPDATTTLKLSPYKYFQIKAILERYNHNIEAIEADIRSAIGRAPRKQIMDEYRQVSHHINNNNNNK